MYIFISSETLSLKRWNSTEMIYDFNTLPEQKPFNPLIIYVVKDRK